MIVHRTHVNKKQNNPKTTLEQKTSTKNKKIFESGYYSTLHKYYWAPPTLSERNPQYNFHHHHHLDHQSFLFDSWQGLHFPVDLPYLSSLKGRYDVLDLVDIA
mmetsp:Transcript_58644/g.66859  ORF Transcript_58644/g.66859 Transcript_58644/m.66859 type:complete len:103 (-) Transcript_58644:125-433(-)